METIHYEAISPSPAEYDLMPTNQQPTLTFPFYEQQEFYPQLPTISYANIKFEALESLAHPSVFTQDKSPFSAAQGTTFSLDSFADSKKVLPITDSQHPLKKKRTRTAYTKSQMNELEQEFQCNKYLPRHRRIKLSQILGIDESKIKIWFQNRRTRAKKEALEQQIPTDSKIPASPPAKTKIEQASLTVLPPTPSPTTASDCSELDEVLDFITEATNHAREVRTVQNIKFDLELSAEAWLHSYKYHPYYN